MPDPNSFWIVAFRPDSEDSTGEITERLNSITGSSSTLLTNHIKTPEFKTAPLSTLISLSELISKQDIPSTQTLLKILDTLRTLDSSRPSTLQTVNQTSDKNNSELIRMQDGRLIDDYVFKNWEWNRIKYNRVESRKLEDLVLGLIDEIVGIDNDHKLKLGIYNQSKAQLLANQRKQTGNLSVRSLNEVVNSQDFVDSEYLQTLLVAVPNEEVKEWNKTYETLTSLVVPRSSIKITSDEDYNLFKVVIFKKIKDLFKQKCREKKFVVRDYVHDPNEIERSRIESKKLEDDEKQIWSELIRLSRINFSDCFQSILHLKIIQTHIESLLRFGLPAHYLTLILKPDSKNSKKILNQLINFSKSLESNQQQQSNKSKQNKTNIEIDETIGGEFASVLEKEVFDFVLFEIVDPSRQVSNNNQTGPS